MRPDGRREDEIRKIQIMPHVNKYAEGSVYIEAGDTKIICTATIEDKVPPFLKGTGKGWVTAEYSMLPRSTQVRNQRESSRGKLGGRTMEIQRLIGRALRAVTHQDALGERTVTIDCDVLQADGGTRTTSITGAFVALVIALAKLSEEQGLRQRMIRDFLASVSVGIVNDRVVLDLNYEEDSACKVDMNVVMTGSGEFVELQGTAEEAPFNRQEFNRMLELAEQGIRSMIDLQKEVLAPHVHLIGEKETVNQDAGEN